MVASDRLTLEQIHFFRLIHYSIPLGKRRQQKDVRSPEDCELQHHSMTCSNTISVPQIPYRALEDKYIVENCIPTCLRTHYPQSGYVGGGIGVEFQPESHQIVELVANPTKANLAIVSSNPYKNLDVRLIFSQKASKEGLDLLCICKLWCYIVSSVLSFSI